MSGVSTGGASQVMNGDVELVGGMRGSEGEDPGPRESGSKCGGGTSMGQLQKSGLAAVILGRIAPRSCL